MRLPPGLTGLLLRGDLLTLCGDLSLRGELWRLLPMLQWSGYVEIDLNLLVAAVERVVLSINLVDSGYRDLVDLLQVVGLLFLKYIHYICMQLGLTIYYFILFQVISSGFVHISPVHSIVRCHFLYNCQV